MTPNDLIDLGAVRGAYGLKGWVRITPFSADGVVLGTVRNWWLQGTAAEELLVDEVKRHGDSIVAKWQGCESKEAADSLKGATIAVSRKDFPALAVGEHYLSDVIGYRVVNREDFELGTVSGLRSGKDGARGAGLQWLEVSSATGAASEQTLLIPLVDRYVDSIESDARAVKVDWHADW